MEIILSPEEAQTFNLSMQVIFGDEEPSNMTNSLFFLHMIMKGPKRKTVITDGKKTPERKTVITVGKRGAVHINTDDKFFKDVMARIMVISSKDMQFFKRLFMVDSEGFPDLREFYKNYMPEETIIEEPKGELK